MYKIMIDCRFGGADASGDGRHPKGFIAVRLEGGDEAAASLAAIARIKTQMVANGYSLRDIEAAAFSIEEIEIVQSIPDDRGFENAFVYYDT